MTYPATSEDSHGIAAGIGYVVLGETNKPVNRVITNY